ncbi:aspartic peptidase domain-containing protein [Globomyces pollinis-pini]|nr:aspartic peptidase domain-containing protein [Globomyces pollinis-pini]
MKLVLGLCLTLVTFGQRTPGDTDTAEDIILELLKTRTTAFDSIGFNRNGIVKVALNNKQNSKLSVGVEGNGSYPNMILDMNLDRTFFKVTNASAITVEEEDIIYEKKLIKLRKIQDKQKIVLSGLESTLQFWNSKDELPSFKYDGVIGIGPNSDFFTGLDFLPGQKKLGIRFIDYFAFSSFQFKFSSSSVCDFGKFDEESIVLENKTTFNLIDEAKDSWKFEVNNFSLKTKNLIATMNITPPVVAYPSASDLYIRVNQTEADVINAGIHASWNDTASAYQLNCSSLIDGNDTVILELNDHSFTIPVNSSIVIKEGNCFSGINRAQQSDKLILGIPFLKSYYVGLDYEQRSVSFYPHKIQVTEIEKADGLLDILNIYSKILQIQFELNEAENIKFKGREVKRISAKINNTVLEIDGEVERLSRNLLDLKVKAGQSEDT